MQQQQLLGPTWAPCKVAFVGAAAAWTSTPYNKAHAGLTAYIAGLGQLHPAHE